MSDRHPPEEVEADYSAAEIAHRRDDALRRMIATPPKAHKEEPKRRRTPSPVVKQLPKRRTNKKRGKA